MSKNSNEARFLALLERILPQATSDTLLAAKIYEKVAKEVRLYASLDAFEKFCTKGSIPDTEETTITELKDQLAGNFGEENVVINPPDETDDEAPQNEITVEITLPDRTVTNKLKVVSPEEAAENDAPFVPFPVALPEDPELVWLLARRENFGPDEANRALAAIEEEFWETKKGQDLQRKGVEKSFAEFLTNVPAALLKDSHLKRFHKDPETLFVLQRLATVQAAAPQMS